MRLELRRRTVYAIRACVHLATKRPGEFASSREIASAMEIPLRFLPHALTDLSIAGIVEAQIDRAGIGSAGGPSDSRCSSSSRP